MRVGPAFQIEFLWQQKARNKEVDRSVGHAGCLFLVMLTFFLRGREGYQGAKVMLRGHNGSEGKNISKCHKVVEGP